METTVFNPTQLYLLQLFSFSTTEDSKQELQDVLTKYYSEKVNKRANELWEKMELNQQKLDSICNIHERLPY
ncbi:MAG: hypothetical protein IJR02_12220 [Bacteroidaceae bacterium]|nr:hypothetical protein [Bacteroidaceae bacterium]